MSWRLITLQYCSGFCHTLTRIRHGFTCIPHPYPPSHLPLDPIPLALLSAPGPGASNYLILCPPLLLLPLICPNIRVFSNESALQIRWAKYWSFSFNISPSNEHPGLIFRMDWLDLLAVQGTLKSILQCHSSKTSLAISFLYSPTLTSTHYYWKNCNLD